MTVKRVAVSNEVLDLKIDNLGARVGGCEDTLKDVAKNLTVLGRLEERFASYLESDRDKSQRITATEVKVDVLEGQVAPMIRERDGKGKTREIYVVAFLGFVGLLAAQVLGTYITTKALTDAVNQSTQAQKTTQSLLATPQSERPLVLDAAKP